MKEASIIFWEKAQEVIKEMEAFAGNEQQLKEFRKVAGQLLFYAGISAIEKILSQKMSIYVIGDHKKRGKAIADNLHLFKNGEKIKRYYGILTESEFDYRRKVAYKGENGNKFALLREFAELCMEEIGWTE
ncbi:MAG: hypothetical protein QME12_01885 [Nanoarchaeota archaeon]|nr:hypothetical protein [Nanoarchaeota archaeon]